MHTNTIRLKKSIPCAVAIAIVLSGMTAHAAKIRINVENLNPEGGLWFSPVFFGFHDGSFDTFDSNDPAALASPAIEAIAEEGDPAGLVSNIGSVAGATSHVLKRDDAAAGPPDAIFSPGSSNSFTLDLNPILNRYLSFASMVVPSNDAFIGNENPTAYDLFNINGNFNSGFTIDIFGTDLWDSGTEANDGMGAAFSAMGGISTSTMDPVTQHTGLDNFIGTELATGSLLQHATSPDSPIARITAERVPDSTPYIGAMGFLAVIAFRVAARRRMGR